MSAVTMPHRTSTTARSFRVAVSSCVYRRRTTSKCRFTIPAKPFSVSPARSSFELIIGESVSATTPETITAPARVKANSRKRAPVSPP